MSKQNAIDLIEGTLLALRGSLAEEGEFAKTYCSVIEERLEEIKKEVEKIDE